MKLESSKKVDVNRWELEISVAPEEFQKEVDKAYNRQKKKISIPGFRAGKAPRAFIEKHYGDKIFYEDAINSLYPGAIEEASKEAGIELVDDHIDFDIIKMGKEEGLVFKVKVTVMPEVTVENYKGIEIKKADPKKVSKEDIEDEIKVLQEKNARIVPADDKTSEMGDLVNIDFEGFVDGKSFEGGTAQDVPLELGKKQFIAGFEEQVSGHKVGDEFEVKVTFPEKYHAPNLAGKEAVFKTKLNKIQAKELPKVDDEFVKDISEFDTLKEFEEDLKKKIAEKREAEAKSAAETEMLDKFIELVKADIPEALIKNKERDLLRDFEYNMQMQGLAVKDYLKYTGMTQEKLMESFKPQALKQVKLDLGFKKVSELENISASSEEIAKEYEDVSKKYNMKVEQVKKFVMENDIKSDIVRRKSLELLKDNCVQK